MGVLVLVVIGSKKKNENFCFWCEDIYIPKKEREKDRIWPTLDAFQISLLRFLHGVSVSERRNWREERERERCWRETEKKTRMRSEE
jgi:hypothetical protein